MKPLLIMRLEGPMQSWGIRSRWILRDCGDEPTKSALIGLLGCALGYPMGDIRLQELDNRVRVGVRVEHPGKKMIDYHTTSGQETPPYPVIFGDKLFDYGRSKRLPKANPKSPGDNNSIVSERFYLTDAAFLVVLDGSIELLKKLAYALKHPVWPIYLGRKSCPPTRPLLEELSTQYDSLEDALASYPWDWEGRKQNNYSNQEQYPHYLNCVVEDLNGEAYCQDAMRINPGRMYGFRRVKYYCIQLPGTKEVEEPCFFPG